MVIFRDNVDKPINISENTFENKRIINVHHIYDGQSSDNSKYENPFKIPSNELQMFSDRYKFVFNEKLNIILDTQIDPENKSKFDRGSSEKEKLSYINVNAIQLDGVPSLFNPLYGVHVKGIAMNTPLLTITDDKDIDDDISDCSIKKLVELSKPEKGRGVPKLGRSIYKYADFMYCKDLGKISNNRLITLRRFALPVGDDIWHVNPGAANIDSDEKDITSILNNSVGNDVGRLVTWLNDDNKLDSILKYEYHDSWRPVDGQFETVNSQAENRGILGDIVNLANPTYRKQVASGYAGRGNNLLNRFGDVVKLPFGKDGQIFSADATYENHEILTRYDQHKIYEPQGTVRDTHIYEGKMTFSQGFSLTFDYELRAYDNINPKTAFLDLLGNIQQVTYRAGNFWGGGRWWVGAPENPKGWRTANAFIDGGWDKLDSLFSSILGSGEDLGSMLGSIANKIGIKIENLFKKGSEALDEAVNNPGGVAQKLANNARDIGAGSMLKGMLKNKLGRPALYALQSILSGEPVGLWHVTIGNPRNPIMSFGNLIMDGATVEHYGPLGIDDFPTGLKVTVTLKHAKSRDMIDIGKMYTMGTSSLYMDITHTGLNKIYNLDLSSMDQRMWDVNGGQVTPGLNY